MDKNEKKLSEYIDKLNAEKMPDEHECLPDSPELEELMAEIRLQRLLLLRSLKSWKEMIMQQKQDILQTSPWADLMQWKKNMTS